MHLGQIIGLQRIDFFIAVSVDQRLAVGSENIVLVRVARILEERSDRIEPKACNAMLDPEALHVVHRLAHRRVVPVQVRLLNVEAMVVVLAGLRVPLPRGVAEDGEPVVRRFRVAVDHLWVVPHVPVALRIGA